MIDLKQFCADEVTMYDMTKPFELDGWACATDGKICVRIPVADYGKPFEQTEKPTPPIQKLAWDKTPDNDAPLVLPPPVIFNCGRCDGKGKHPQMGPCSRCKGSGNCGCNCPKCDDACDECGGDGEAPISGTKVFCQECLGTGDDRFLFDNWIFARMILSPIAAMPNAHGGIIDRKSGAAKFVFDGGEAMVMGMTGDVVDRELVKRRAAMR